MPCAPVVPWVPCVPVVPCAPVVPCVPCVPCAPVVPCAPDPCTGVPLAYWNPAAITLPVALIKPVTYSPVVAKTATLPVPPMPTVILEPDPTTVTLLVPLLILATLVITPVNSAPFPRI